MKNITVSVDDECHRLARIRAAELGTSVSALVRGYLGNLTTDRDRKPEGSQELRETPYQRRCRQLRKVFSDFDAQDIGLRMSENLPRDALYDRAAMRSETTTQRHRSSGSS
ncbi:MAG: hypothetical protein OXG51_05520 [Gammaproteobacteria bacterium]|nr:hypothetical protein [Gammaproteobacteria bacterium]